VSELGELPAKDFALFLVAACCCVVGSCLFFKELFLSLTLFFLFLCFVLVSRYTRKWVWKFVRGDLLDWKQSSKWVSKRRGEKIWRAKVDELFEFLGLKDGRDLRFCSD
jgi:hypothetical protein